MFKSRFKFLTIMFCVSVLLLGGTLIFCANNQNLGGNVDVTYTAPPQTDDLWDASTKTFKASNLNTLLQQISNDPNSLIDNLSTIDSLATARTSAGTMRTYTTGKTSVEDITVELGGLNWTATYLSKDKNDNIILTLWLDNCVQDAWKDRLADEGKYYGFINGGLFSRWSANFKNGEATDDYPPNMYGSSYIRAVTLNNGGTYATSGSVTESCEQNENSVFALFTMEQYGLTDYIVKPKDVSWQENEQHAKKQIGFSYDMLNDNWSQQMTGDFQYGFNYAGKEANDDWSEDYLWLPSLTETGFSDSQIGIWQTLVAQRTNGSHYTSAGSVGSIGGEAEWSSWLRSGGYGSADYAYGLNTAGLGNERSTVDYSYAIRPALHLNLTEAVKNAK